MPFPSHRPYVSDGLLRWNQNAEFSVSEAKWDLPQRPGLLLQFAERRMHSAGRHRRRDPSGPADALRHPSPPHPRAGATTGASAREARASPGMDRAWFVLPALVSTIWLTKKALLGSCVASQLLWNVSTVIVHLAVAKLSACFLPAMEC